MIMLMLLIIMVMIRVSRNNKMQVVKSQMIIMKWEVVLKVLTMMVVQAKKIWIM